MPDPVSTDDFLPADDGLLVVNARIRIPIRELEFTYARSSGPGGQNVNKVNSKAILRWAVGRSASLPDDVRQRLRAHFRSRFTQEGDLLIIGQRYRDAGRNAADCLERLREMLSAVAVPPKPRRPTRPSKGSIRRRLEQKGRQAAKKQSRRAGGED